MHSKGYTAWTRKHAFFALMGGLRSYDGTILRSGRDLYKLEGAGQLSLREFDFQALLDDIEDKSKADVLGKMLAVVQISRFLAGTLTRLVQNLLISPLEWSESRK